jgi:outer membrane protein assembly factor BamE (lipoprotein component of BamABCDE complex)
MKKILSLALALFVAGTSVFAIEDAAPQKTKRKKKQPVVAPVQEQELTLGIAQRELKAGVSMDEVALILGSPNIVTRDAEGKDTWIYDKVSRVTSYSGSGGGATIILAGYSKSKSDYQTTQKTLTIVIKFDKNNKIETMNYHMSKF